MDVKISVFGIDGQEEKKISLPKEIFAEPVNKKLLAQYIRVYLANQKQGTASTKTRGEVTGSTRKIYRQKGTGRARHGDIKAPIFVGGGVVGGPKPHRHLLKMTKKQKRKTLLAALSLKSKEKNIIGLSNQFAKIEPKTKTMVKFLTKIKFDKSKILIVLPNTNYESLVLAMRNLPDTAITYVDSINPYQILKFDKIFLIEEALTVLKNSFNHEN